MAMTAFLILSCNKNRFDFDNLESVEGSGQWKLPIGSMRITVDQVLQQFGENEFISTDDQGNLRMTYSFKKDDLVKGSTFLNIGSLHFNSGLEFPNPFPGLPVPDSINIDTVVYYDQELVLTGDSARLESVLIKSGVLSVSLNTNLGHISAIDLWSNDITFPNGGFLNETFTQTNHDVDLAGATFTMVDPVTGIQDSTFVLNYAVHYQLDGIDDPMYSISTDVNLIQLKLQEITGYIDAFTYDFEFDTAFSLPIRNIDGQLSLVGAQLQILEQNTFGNLRAKLFVDEAELYGDGVRFPILDSYPVSFEVVPSDTYIPAFDETLNVIVNTQVEAVRASGRLDFNPEGVETLLRVNENSMLGLSVDAVVPMCFNVSNVSYIDTLDVNLSDITAPDLVKEVLLTILFDSEMPFTFSAQLFTLDSLTGRVTDSLLTNEMVVNGSFNGVPVPSEATISVTQSRLQHLFEANKMVMRLGMDTDNHDVMLNRRNGLGLTVKADVIYGGSVDINN